MNEISCCSTFSSLLEPIVKAYKYMTGIFSVTDTSEPQVSNRDDQDIKMERRLLEKQYNQMKQKLKLQPPIIVYKTGEHESVPLKSMVKGVLINREVKILKSFADDPVGKVTLETTSWGNVQYNSLWYTHLQTHHLSKISGQRISWDLDNHKNEPQSFDNNRLISKGDDTLQPKELGGASEQSALRQPGSSSTSNSFSKENDCSVSSSCQKLPLKSATSAVWTCQPVSSIKYTSACNKQNFYPLSNKKGLRISETARRLGLYASK